MGEIKSTLELAMERAKRFSVSQKEKDEMKQKEVFQKATSLFHRYREGHLFLDDLLKETERMERQTATRVKAYLLSRWIDALSLDDDNEKILKGVGTLKEKSIAEVEQEFHQLLFQYEREKEKVKETLEVQLVEALKKEGIWGSAVEPRLEGSELWKKENEEFVHPYRIKLEEIKEQLRSL